MQHIVGVAEDVGVEPALRGEGEEAVVPAERAVKKRFELGSQVSSTL